MCGLGGSNSVVGGFTRLSVSADICFQIRHSMENVPHALFVLFVLETAAR